MKKHLNYLKTDVASLCLERYGYLKNEKVPIFKRPGKEILFPNSGILDGHYQLLGIGLSPHPITKESVIHGRHSKPYRPSFQNAGQVNAPTNLLHKQKLMISDLTYFGCRIFVHMCKCYTQRMSIVYFNGVEAFSKFKSGVTSHCVFKTNDTVEIQSHPEASKSIHFAQAFHKMKERIGRLCRNFGTEI